MRIHLSFSSLRKTSFHEYAIRFLFGGSITVIAGVVGKFWGAGLAGLLLAFPAIFPASATLVAGHQIQEKHNIGQHGSKRGREAAAVDAAGAASGCIGLIAFALFVWGLLGQHTPVLVLIAAAALWFVVAFAMWRIHKTFRKIPKLHGID
jgi:TctA family transporter